MSLTKAQREAIEQRGNVLVVAGAGTGKTRTLVERCLGCLLNEKPRISIEEILVVTFTEAAAAEVRQRLRDRLEQERRADPLEKRWQEQLALFENAHIGTLHSFCLQLVRQHFYQLELDPQLTVLSEQEARLLAGETLDALLRQHYSGKGKTDQQVRRLIQTHGRGWDKPIRTLVLRLHDYTQSLPDPQDWVTEQLKMFAAAEPLLWRGWLGEAIADWCKEWLPMLKALSPTNKVAARSAEALRTIASNASTAEVASSFDEIRLAGDACPRGKGPLWLEPLEGFLADALFLGSLVCVPGSPEPLAQDWAWVREPMTTLLELSRGFSQSFTEAKRELGVVDFPDLEQYALRLLWDHHTEQPTGIARHWRQKLRFVFVDEYQDINAAQDRIIQALSRDGSQANRFLVGDVKQSIYRFRLANPRIFQGYTEQWSGGQGRVIPLVENFRGREALLKFTNSVFGLLMRKEVGGLDYDSSAALRFGAPQERAPLSLASNSVPRAELHLFLKSGEELPDNDEAAESLAEVVDLRDADKEARLVALRLRDLRAQQHLIWDVETMGFRPADWKDMAILLRSPAKKAESYAKEFARLGLPLQVARGGFYQSLEISDLLSLLQLLNNPLQDLPVLAVLHSPLVGLSANELAEIRLAGPRERFWTALLRWHRKGSGATSDGQIGPGESLEILAGSETHNRVAEFLRRFGRWRRLARQVSLSRCLELVLGETQYDSWLLSQPRGQERYANLQRLLTLAQEFDRFQRQGLFRFLKFVEAQREAETEPEIGAASAENAVRLMSIHQSKGLEFPVVVLADLGKPFNMVDLRGELILDEQYGLCPHVKPAHTGKRYPSLPYWLARRRQLRELLGEELRLLYVAMTRARDTLILSGSVSRQHFSKHWVEAAQADGARRLTARNYCDWLGWWFSQNVGAAAKQSRKGTSALLDWAIHDHSELVDARPQGPAEPPGEPVRVPAESEKRDRVEQQPWTYPFVAATEQAAKTSVSALRRQAEVRNMDEAADFFSGAAKGFRAQHFTRFVKGPNNKNAAVANLTAADIGSAHHEFLRLVNLERTGDTAALSEEARRLQVEGRLSPAQVAVLDFAGLARFWNSALGQRIRAHQALIHRELPFTARFSPAELASSLGDEQDPSLADEFIVVQGVADLAVVAPDQIWLVDFKTDQVDRKELAGVAKTYELQLRLYASALSKIYCRPVSECWLYFLTIAEAVRTKC